MLLRPLDEVRRALRIEPLTEYTAILSSDAEAARAGAVVPIQY
jgi:hypothetical protein